MESPPVSLFQGTSFAPKFQVAIWSDIKSLIRMYPTITYSHFATTPYHKVLLQGYINIKSMGQEIPLPINMMLPDNFPMAAPITEISFPQNVPFMTSPALRQNKSLVSETIIKWTPMKVTLPQYVSSIQNFFSMYPPYSPQYAPIVRQMFASMQRQMQQSGSGSGMASPKPSAPTSPSPANMQEIYDDAYATADSLVNKYNDIIKNGAESEKEACLTHKLIEIINGKIQQLDTANKQLDAKAAEMGSPQIPDYQIDPSIEEAFKGKASDESLEATAKDLRDDFRDHKITLDEYLAAIKAIHKTHFENVIFPRCQ